MVRVVLDRFLDGDRSRQRWALATAGRWGSELRRPIRLRFHHRAGCGAVVHRRRDPEPPLDPEEQESANPPGLVAPLVAPPDSQAKMPRAVRGIFVFVYTI